MSVDELTMQGARSPAGMMDMDLLKSADWILNLAICSTARVKNLQCCPVIIFSSLPSDKTYMKYVGCMSDARDNRLLPSYNTNFRQDNTPKFCVDYCLRIGTV